MFKRVWQVVETIFLVETCENLEFFIFFRILLVQVEKNYTKNNDLQYFLFQINIANAILHADEVLQHKFFFELQIYKKISLKLCLVKLFISLPKNENYFYQKKLLFLRYLFFFNKMNK